MKDPEIRKKVGKMASLNISDTIWHSVKRECGATRQSENEVSDTVKNEDCDLCHWSDTWRG